MKFLVKEVPKEVIQSCGEKILANVPMNELERQVKNTVIRRYNAHSCFHYNKGGIILGEGLSFLLVFANV
jgi:hypothetical protein